jgi:transcriptional regulator with XRE-family HTH domain
MSVVDLAEGNRLGAYLRDRRARMDPAAFGLPPGRRRTPGLRREEVAQRANISATWYTWLEQGRGGAASADVLDRLAKALMLTDVEREHLFLLGLGRPPEVRYQPTEGVSPRLQRVLDALSPTPAMIKNPMWDVVAWNEAAAATLTDYAVLPPRERNILRMMFSSRRVRAAQADWESVARFVVGGFRADTVRAGASAQVAGFVEEMIALSPDFERMWRDNDVRGHGDGLKRIHHPDFGAIDLEMSVFAVDGRPDLSMLVYNPMDPAMIGRIEGLIAARSSG